MRTSAINVKVHSKLLLIRPEHLNPFETLYGGNMMKWADEMAYIAATLEYPFGHFVTKLFETFNFNSAVHQGDIIKIHSQIVEIGNSSVRVKVWADNLKSQKTVFDTYAVMVNVQDGHSATIPTIPTEPTK